MKIPAPSLLSRLLKPLLIRYLEARHGRVRMMKLLLERHLQRHYLPGPEIELTEEKIRRFESVYEAAIEGETGAGLEYDCAYPKYEFLHYLVEHKGLLLHGSNEPDIELLSPLRKSSDTRAYGNLASVYACSDGVWPIFYALVNRRRGVRCHIYTRCLRLDAKGRVRKLYRFSLKTETRQTELWKDGTVYVVGREKFKRLKDPAGYVLEEWACAESVRPLMKLHVSPADFPFLKETRVRGFAGTEAGRAGGNGPAIHSGYAGRYELEGGMPMSVAGDQNFLYVRLAEYPSLIFYPAADDIFTLGESQIIFDRNTHGESARLTFRLLGRDIPARRVA